MDDIEAELSERNAFKYTRCCLITDMLLENTNKVYFFPPAVRNFTFAETWVGQGLNKPEISGLLHSVILPSVQHNDPVVRNLGIKTLGLFCLLDQVFTLDHYYIFLESNMEGYPLHGKLTFRPDRLA